MKEKTSQSTNKKKDTNPPSHNKASQEKTTALKKHQKNVQGKEKSCCQKEHGPPQGSGDRVSQENAQPSPDPNGHRFQGKGEVRANVLPGDPVEEMLQALATAPSNHGILLALRGGSLTSGAVETMDLRCVSGIEKKGEDHIRITLYDRLAATELLMKWRDWKKRQEKDQEVPSLYRLLGQGFAPPPDKSVPAHESTQDPLYLRGQDSTED